MKLAEFIQRTSDVVERYPVSISVITEKTKVVEDYDGFGKTTTIPADSLVLFVYGKYRHQVPIFLYDDDCNGDRRKRKTIHPWYLIKHDLKFKDIKTDFEEM